MVTRRVQRLAWRSFFVGATQRLPLRRPGRFWVTVNLTVAASESVKRIVVPFGAFFLATRKVLCDSDSPLSAGAVMSTTVAVSGASCGGPAASCVRWSEAMRGPGAAGAVNLTSTAHVAGGKSATPLHPSDTI